MKRIGIMTGGGDAPGLNGVIESAVRTLSGSNFEIVGICDGFEGVFNLTTKNLNPETILGVHAEAGTVLGTSNKSRTEGREKEFITNYEKLKLDGLIAVGGDGTFSGLSRVLSGLKMIGVPKTIDNDLQGTDMTFGYDTACAVVAESVDALRATAAAHRRIIVVETMGRTAGWIALGSGLASYADAILIPERGFSKKKLVDYVLSRKNQGQRGLVIVVAEGAAAEGESPTVAFTVEGSPEKERFGGIAQSLSRWLEAETGWESRHVVLGHLQRSRSPTTTDRFLTLAMGIEAARMVMDSAWGQAVVYRNGLVQRAPVTDLMKPARRVDPNHRWVQFAQQLGIFI